jgi:hypothetical protein
VCALGPAGEEGGGEDQGSPDVPLPSQWEVSHSGLLGQPGSHSSSMEWLCGPGHPQSLSEVQFPHLLSHIHMAGFGGRGRQGGSVGCGR